MKKVLSIVAIAALSAAFVSCGPSKEEQEKREKDKQDSITAVEKTKQDSIAGAEADAEKKAFEAKAHIADSLRNDSIAKAAAAPQKGKKSK